MVPIVVQPPNPDDFLKVKCRGCFAIIGYVPNEVKEYHGSDYGGGPAGRKWIDCPHCKNEIILDSW